MRAEVDVVVVGLGALGASAATALAQSGLSVLGVDRHRPPHPHGSSHGGSRIIRRVYSEGASYVPLVDRSYRLWRDLERQTGCQLLLPRGALFLGDQGSEMVDSALACAGECRLDHQLLDAQELSRRFPPLEPPTGTRAVFDPAGGVLLPENCVEALLVAATRAGAELRFGCAVEDWRRADDGVLVDCEGGSVRGRHLVLATGAWLADAARARGMGLAVERQVQHWFEPPAGGCAAAELPPFVWQLTARRTWYGLPDLGQGLKAGIHRGGELTTASDMRHEIEPGEVEDVRRLVERYLPNAAGPCRTSKACMYTNTPDLRFLAGPLPDEPRVWVLGGGSGHAFKFAPALGELVARGLSERKPPAALKPFLPARFTAG